MSLSHEPVDVAVAGGGLVGSAIVAAIASDPMSRGLSVVLIDPQPPSLHNIPPVSLRTSTITPSSKEFLQDMSVWPMVPVSRIAPFQDMLIWDCPSKLKRKSFAGALHFDARMNNTNELGYVVDNDTLRYAIFSRIRELQQEGQTDLKVLPSAIRDIDFGDDSAGTKPHPNEDALLATKWPVIHMDSGDSVAARLLIACDGARSRVRMLCGLDWFQKSYDQSAVVATVTLSDPIYTAYQRFLSTGPLAVLPMASGGPSDAAEPLANIVWTTTPTEARALDAVDDRVFIKELNVALTEREEEPTSETAADTELDDRADRVWGLARSVLGISAGSEIPLPKCLAVHGHRGSFPLYCGHAPRYIDPQRRTVLVGDAAHNIHPLAGQGVNLGFGDARSLAEAISSAAGNGRDIGGENGAPLMQYQAERLLANVAMMSVLHSIQKTFTVNSPNGFRDLRRVGMSLLNASGPAKRTILRIMR